MIHSACLMINPSGDRQRLTRNLSQKY